MRAPEPTATGPEAAGPPGGPAERRLKRIFDVVVATLMAVLFAPLACLVALLILAADGRPVLYGHERIGLDGRRFRCLKFRTMVRDSDDVLKRLLAEDCRARAEWARDQKLSEDPRVIRGVGRLLRSSSLDELPQIANVLQGDMSIVGPRPVVESELRRYGAYRPHYLSVRPGLTGLWQIGGRSNTSYADRVALDVRYVEDGSIWTDVRILLRTAAALVTGRLGGAR